MSASAPRISKPSPDMHRVTVALGALTLAVALLVGVTVVRQAATQTAIQAAQSHKVSAGGFTGIPYTPSTQSHKVGAGRYTGIPYTPSTQSHKVSAGGFTGIPYTPSTQSHKVSAGGFTGIPYTPSTQSHKVSAGGFPGIPYTPSTVDRHPRQVVDPRGRSQSASGGMIGRAALGGPFSSSPATSEPAPRLTKSTAASPSRRARAFALYPFLFAAYPVLFLWSQNLGEVDPVEVVGPLLIVGAVALVATFLIGLLFRDVRRAALIVSVTVVVVLMYGHVLRILPPDPIPDRFQKAAMAGCIVLAVLVAWRLSPRILAKVDTALTRVSLILVAVTLVMIVPYLLPGLFGRPMVRPVEPAYTTSTTAPLRDVYYLIFDRYGSDASLLSRYGKQNELTPWLREQGFTVLDDSHANYVRTGLSLASTLNITHLDDLAAAMGPENTDQAPFRSALASSVVAKQMKALGYTYHHLGTWWNPSAEDPVADVNHRLDSSSDFASVLFETTALPPITTRLGLTERTPSAGTRNYENGIFEMDTLDDPRRRAGAQVRLRARPAPPPAPDLRRRRRLSPGQGGGRGRTGRHGALGTPARLHEHPDQALLRGPARPARGPAPDHHPPGR